MPSSESSGFDSADVISPTDVPPEAVDTDIDAESTATTGTEPDSFPDTEADQMFEMSPEDDKAAAGDHFVEIKNRQKNIKCCSGKQEQLETASKIMTQKNEKDVESRQLVNILPEDEQEAMSLPEVRSGVAVNQRYELEKAKMTFPSYEWKISAAPGYERKWELSFNVYGLNKVATSHGNERHDGIALGCEDDGERASRRCEQHGIASSWRCEQHATASSWRRGKHGTAASSKYNQHGTLSSRGNEKHGATASRKHWQQETREFLGYERKTVTTFTRWERQEVAEFVQYKQLQTTALLHKAQEAMATSIYDEKGGKKEKEKRILTLTEYEEEKQYKGKNEEKEDKGKEEIAAALPKYEKKKIENEDKSEGKKEKGNEEKANDKEVTLPKCEHQKSENMEPNNNFSLLSYPFPSENRRSFPCYEEKTKRLKDKESERRRYSGFDNADSENGQRPEPDKVSSFQLRM